MRIEFLILTSSIILITNLFAQEVAHETGKMVRKRAVFALYSGNDNFYKVVVLDEKEGKSLFNWAPDNSSLPDS